MTTKQYRSQIADEIRLLLLSNLLDDRFVKLTIATPKKSPNKMKVYSNKDHKFDILITSKDKFLISDTTLKVSYRGKKIFIREDSIEINGFDDLKEYIIETLL